MVIWQGDNSGNMRYPCGIVKSRTAGTGQISAASQRRGDKIATHGRGKFAWHLSMSGASLPRSWSRTSSAIRDLRARDEDLTLARLRALRSDLIDPIIAVHHGRIVKRTGDGALVEFRSVVDAVRCAIEVQNGWWSATQACRRSGASNSASASILAM